MTEAAEDGYYVIDFECPTNQDWADSFVIKAGDPLAPRDLTGCAFQMHIRRAPEDTRALMILNGPNGRLGISGDPEDGTIAIYVPDEHVQRIPPGEYAHDILMFDASNNPKRIAVGTVTVLLGVTRV